ncbi:MAG: alanine racemase [Rickettsiales bacterium]
MNSSHPNYATLTVNLSALRANYALLKSTLGGKACASVVKANAYGLGVEQVSKSLWEEGCRHFFVATLKEGIELRSILPDADIYVFFGVQPGEAKAFCNHKLIPVLNSMEQIAAWKPHAAGGIGATLHVDTGITRIGLSEAEAMEIAGDDTLRKNLGLKLVMSHLACGSDEKHAKNAEQLSRFTKIAKAFDGISTSFANSSGVFLPADYHFDLARPGCALYGINPTSGANPMQHVATLSAPILQIRVLAQDETVGYGATFTAKKGNRIALTALGYADGIFRSLGNKGHAMIAGHKVPFAGRVSMDMIALDVTNIPDSALTDDMCAEFINADLTVNDMANQCDTIGYEIFTRIGARVKRLYK